MGNDTICGPNAATSALPPPRSRRAADGSGHPAGWGKRVPMARPAPLERGTAGGIPGRPQPKRARPLPLRYVHTRRGRPHPQKGDVHTRKRGTSPPAGGGRPHPQKGGVLTLRQESTPAGGRPHKPGPPPPGSPCRPESGALPLPAAGRRAAPAAPGPGGHRPPPHTRSLRAETGTEMPRGEADSPRPGGRHRRRRRRPCSAQVRVSAPGPG